MKHVKQKILKAAQEGPLLETEGRENLVSKTCLKNFNLSIKIIRRHRQQKFKIHQEKFKNTQIVSRKKINLWRKY